MLKYQEKYHNYLQSLKDTTDEIILTKIHFYYKVRAFFKYRNSMRLGDSLIEDFLCSKWISLLHISGNNYFNLGLSHMTSMQNLDPETYMRVKIISHILLHGGKIGS